MMDGGVPNIKKWVVVYPVYINSKKTIAEGRRISVEKGVRIPLVLRLVIAIDKAYPRDFMQVGRVRVLLKREDGSLCNPAIPSRKQLMLHVAELVPRHPGRTKKQEPVSTSNAATSKSGKGGKKKR
ncbi:signal recognition particle protein [Salix suchowensis]|nr:signal recognition particle protein [Salix suchowensis]